MSVPQQSMPPVSQYAPKPTVAGHSDSTSTTTASASNAMSTSTASSAPVSQTATTTSSSAMTATSANAATTTTADPTATTPVAGGGIPGTTIAAADWRDKDADRGARQQIARIILTLIMKSANRPTSANYNPREIARRLEHTLYMGAPSKQEYSNVQTLKARLQQALDNSRRRQMQQQQARLLQQQQQQLQASGVPADAAQQQAQAQLLQQRQMALLQRQQQQQMAAALHNQRANFQAVPFPGASAAMNQPASVNQPLQMPVNMSQMGVKTPGSIAAVSSTPVTTVPSPGATNSILDELDREADEMANGVKDQPLSMPESELQSATTPTGAVVAGNPASAASFANVTPTAASPTVVASAGSGSFNAVPLSMPPDISVSSATASSGGLVQPTPSMISAASAGTAGTNMYHGMNLTGPQIQQIQQIQQMQQLRRMQQLQQLQQQQLNGKVSAAQLQAGAAVPASGVSTTPAPATGNGGSPGLIQMNEVSIAQKREELKRRLIQLKHARTCTTGECAIDYCSRTKALLSHVSRCANAQCTTLGCKSTRQLLSHFRKCRNLQCDVCSAIRPPMNENEQQLVLRRQQERLCMLRHASTCTAQQCILPYCAGMKVLWKHICECHQRQCRTDHCISSRYVLSHFKQCNKMICEVCGPVRKAIKVIDSCRGNPTQLQLAASQCPDGVRGLIKIMNTTTAAVPGSAPASAKQAGVGNGSALQANMKAEGAAVAGALNGGTKGAGTKDSSLLEEMKKKPLKLQTEKEKKLRRKEQAKIAKARAQAKAAAAAAAALTGPVSALTGSAQPVMHNGLVVRGTQAELRGDHHVSHQDISFLDSMTEGQLDEHIRSLRFNFCGHISIGELKSRLMPLLQKLMDSEYGWTFNNPVDPVQWNIPDYFDIIKCPMDLGTIKKRLENEHYNSVEAFAGDVRLVFENCIAYNSSTNKFNIAAKQLLASFNKSLATLKNQLEKQLFKRCEQRREEMCQLCGGDSFKFAPCMLFCSGPCAGRIRRHTHYYSDPRGEHHWCSSCYKQMKDGPIDMSLLPQLSSAATEVAPPPGAGLPFDGVLKKSSLIKRKNSEVAEEPWVECDSCKLWYHQICALFNERNHAISGEQEPFVCPICVKKQRAAGVKPSMDNGLKAKRLPITRMAKLIETRVMEAIEKAGEDEAVRMGNMGNSDSIGFSNGTKESASDTQFGITIREVLSIDKQVQVKPRMGKLLSGKYDKPKKGGSGATGGAAGQTKSLKRPRSTGSGADKKAASASSSLSLQLTYRSRCICVFQELDGVDVLIFTLYVQEYGPDSLSPNAGRVYVSYLDSVNYFQPKKLRTLMHQQVMLGFLEDCKNRGFHTCHIWSCPPLKGDDYIFFCKPENQKIPKSARLRQWYQKLLVQAKHDGLVVNISNLYAEYYLKKKAAHELPYFEGDYWPRLAEDLIKQLEEKDNGNRAKTDGTNAGDAASKGSSVSGASTPANAPQTPISRSPSPAESSNENGSAAVDSKASASKKGAMTPNANSKSKSKRSKKGGFATEPSVTRSSASKARSKKGGKSSRPSSSSKNVVNNDPLMQKLKGILEPQKEDFFVVDLYPKCHKCGVPIVHEGYWELKTVPPPASVNNLLEAAKKTRSSSSSSRNSPPRHYHYFYCGSCYETNKTQLLHRVEVSGNCAKRAKELSERILPLNEKAAAAELAELDLQEIKFEAALNFVDPMQEEEEEVQVKQEGHMDSEKDDVKTESPDEKVKENGDAEAEAGVTDTKEASDKPAGEITADTSADTASAAEKASAPPSVKETQSEEGKDDGKAEDQTTEVKDTKAETVVVKKMKRCIGDDLDDVIMPCEIFDTREAFLLYCQNNHCQFDQIRRAKHSSMMVLYHLFNQGTTGFTFSCSNCKTTLLSGNRWNCSICPVFNLCDSCHTKTKHEHQLHLFKVVSIPRPDNEVANETVSTKVKGVVSKAGGATGRAIKREAGSADLKRAKHAKHVKAAGQKAGGSRKRKLHQSSPVATPAASPPVKQESAVAPDAVATAASDGVAASAAATPTAAASGSNGSSSDGDAAKKRRIHNIDPQLLLQLEHASSCTVPNCTFFNCNRMQAMLKHGAICEQRLAGPCVLCKRIIGLLSAHARQCTKDYATCKVPRCADIRRHFLAQVQARQQQLQRARELQAQQAANGAVATTDAASAPAASATEKTDPAT